MEGLIHIHTVLSITSLNPGHNNLELYNSFSQQVKRNLISSVANLFWDLRVAEWFKT